MPPLDTQMALGVQARIMLLGDALLRKTDWIGGIAEAGFNVIYIDGDGNPQRLFARSPQARARIAYINAVDTTANQALGFFALASVSGNAFLWNETTKSKLSLSFIGGADHSQPHLLFDPAKLTSNDFLVFDSWTALVRSFQSRYAKEQNIDIEGSSTMDTDWKDYRWTGAIASKIVEQLKKLPCHSVVVCHSERFEKKDKEGKVIGVKNKPISTSRTNADTLPKNFTDVLYFSMVGSNIYIETKPEAEIVAGSRSFAPVRDTWEKFQFSHFAQLAGMKPTGAPCEAVKFFAPGELKLPGAISIDVVRGPTQVIPQPVQPPRVSLLGLGKKG